MSKGRNQQLQRGFTLVELLGVVLNRTHGEALLETEQRQAGSSVLDVLSPGDALDLGAIDLLEARLARLPSEELADLLPTAADAPDPGLGRQVMRIALLDKLADARGRGEGRDGPTVAELARSRSRSLCCGSGGGYAWMDDEPEKRISHTRFEELMACGAATAAVSSRFTRNIWR